MIDPCEIEKLEKRLAQLRACYEAENEPIPPRYLRCILEGLQRDISTLSERIHKLELFCHSSNPVMAAQLEVFEELPM